MNTLARIRANWGHPVRRNAVAVLVGSGSALALLFTFNILAARALEPTDFGVLVLILALQALLDRVFNFQAWQGLIRFGSDPVRRGAHGEVARVARWSYLLDASAATTACAVGLLGLGVWGRLVPVIAPYRAATLIAVVGVVALATGSSIGILRLFDRFWLAVVPQVLGGVIRVGGIIWLMRGTPTIARCVALSVGADLATALLLHLFALLILQRWTPGPAVPDAPTTPFTPRAFVRFGLATNLTGTVRLVSRELDVFILGGISGPAAAGVYKLAKQVASVPLLVTDALYQSIYPHLAAAVAAGKRGSFRRAVRLGILVAGIGAVALLGGFLLVGRPVLDLVLGPRYSAVYWIAVIYMCSVALAAAFFPLQPAMLASGQARQALQIMIACSLIYLCALPLAASVAGAEGVAAGYLAFYLPWTGLTASALWRKGYL